MARILLSFLLLHPPDPSKPTPGSVRVKRGTFFGHGFFFNFFGHFPLTWTPKSLSVSIFSPNDPFLDLLGPKMGLIALFLGPFLTDFFPIIFSPIWPYNPTIWMETLYILIFWPKFGTFFGNFSKKQQKHGFWSCWKTGQRVRCNVGCRWLKWSFYNQFKSPRNILLAFDLLSELWQFWRFWSVVRRGPLLSLSIARNRILNPHLENKLLIFVL